MSSFANLRVANSLVNSDPGLAIAVVSHWRFGIGAKRCHFTLVLRVLLKPLVTATEDR